MRIDTLSRRWLEVLAGLFLAWREHRREQHSLIISEENGGLVARTGERDTLLKGERSKAHVISAATPVPEELARAARAGCVTLELAAEKIVTRRISVPAQAREFLPGIVRNQIERLSPWPVGQVMHGFFADAGAEHGAMLDVRVFMTSRAIIDEARQALAAIGWRVDRVAARLLDPGADEKTPSLVALWSRIADAPRDGLAEATRLLGVSLAAAVGLALVLSVWAVASASSIRRDSEELASRSRVLQRQLQDGRTPESIASLPPEQRAWRSKETVSSSVIVIEALSRAIPDTAHLSEIRLDGATLRIIGLTDDAPALLAPLEQSGHLTNVRFFAPTTRAPDGRLSRFHIEARVEPRNTIEDE